MAMKSAVFPVLFVFALSLAGCATASKDKGLEIQGLKNQITVLEAEIQAKDEQIGKLREALVKTGAEGAVGGSMGMVSKKKTAGEVKTRFNVKQVQIALRNAGYNPGPVDGRMGKRTSEAVKAYQKSNNLAATGKVDKETWVLLKEYLYKKIK